MLPSSRLHLCRTVRPQQPTKAPHRRPISAAQWRGTCVPSRPCGVATGNQSVFAVCISTDRLSEFAATHRAGSLYLTWPTTGAFSVPPCISRQSRCRTWPACRRARYVCFATATRTSSARRSCSTRARSAHSTVCWRRPRHTSDSDRRSGPSGLRVTEPSSGHSTISKTSRTTWLSASDDSAVSGVCCAFYLLFVL